MGFYIIESLFAASCELVIEISFAIPTAALAADQLTKETRLSGIYF
jgi:hypothetical protein